jgi:hypothetical protein
MKLFSILSLLFLFGCAEQAPKTNMKISIGAVTGSGNFPGGLFIMGKEISTGNTFSKKVPDSDVLDLELPNGDWKFLAIGWDSGTEHFEGTVFCDTKDNVSLNGGEFNLNLNATAAGCSHSVFGAFGANNFLPVSFKSCLDAKPYIINGQLSEQSMLCGGSSPLLDGGAQSVRISMMNLGLGQSFSAANVALTSKCIPFSGSLAASSIKLPFGSSSVPMPLYIETFTNSSCSGGSEMSQYLLTKGLSQPSPANRAIGISNLSSQVSIFLHEDACNAAQLIDSPFGNGLPSAGFPRLICNEAQWDQIDGDIGTNAEQTYIIGADILFGGSNTEITNVFNGSIRGSTRTLSNGNSPLFSSVQPGTSTETFIRDLKIDSFIITDASAGDNVGVLARTLNGGSVKKFEIGDLEITNSSLSISNGSWTGNAGGMFGEINLSSHTDYVGIRKSKVLVDITSNSSSLSNVGGLVGEARGPAGGGLYFEVNSVGVDKLAYQFEMNEYPDLDSHAVNITGDFGSKIGGMFGTARELEIRAGNLISSRVSATDKVGGFTGEAHTALTIKDSTSKLVFTPTGVSSKIGGAVADIGGTGHTLNLDMVVSNLVIPSSSYVVSRVGGLLANTPVLTNSSQVQIEDSRSVLISYTDGSLYGGFFGSFEAGSSGSDVIKRSTSISIIHEKNTNTPSNTKRGGIAGQSKYLKGKMLLVDAEVKGYSQIGGAAGYSQNSIIVEGLLDVDLLSTRLTGMVETGGIVGSSNVGDSYTKIHVKGKVDVVASSGCTTDKCGVLLGNSSSTPVFDNILHPLTLEYDVNSSATDDSGTLSNGTASPTATFATDSSPSCTALSTPFTFDAGISSCVPIFEKRWREYGYKYSDGLARDVYLAGNLLEPFEIHDDVDWNGIQSDAFLVNKSFKLINDINLSAGAVGIGSNTNKFTGNIIPNHKRITGLSYTTGQNTDGVFRYIEGARIGLKHDPLIIDYFNLTTSGHARLGFIGESSNSDISVQVSNLDISGSATNTVGGLVGGVMTGQTRIENSGVRGKIILPSTDGVGGLVGENVSGDIYIENSHANLLRVSGNQHVGGFIGKVTTGTNSIENSYVWFDRQNENSGDDIEVSISGIAGVVGNLLAGSTSIEKTYVDFSNAQFNASADGNFNHFVALGGGGSVTSKANSAYIGPFKLDGMEGSTPTYANSTDLAVAEGLEVGNDWWFDETTSLVNAWQNPEYDSEI